MTCIRLPGAIICVSPSYRLRLADGRCVFIEWHDYLGPTVYRDRAYCRQIEEWWDDPMICNAIDWFAKRGNKA